MSSNSSHLPEGAIRLITDLGEADAMQVLASLGGAKLVIPKLGIVNHHRLFLVERLGERLADQLATHYGGKHDLYVPNCRKVINAARNAEIVSGHHAALAKGDSVTYSVAVLALKFGLTSGAVRGVLRQSQAGVEG